MIWQYHLELVVWESSLQSTYHLEFQLEEDTVTLGSFKGSIQSWSLIIGYQEMLQACGMWYWNCNTTCCVDIVIIFQIKSVISIQSITECWIDVNTLCCAVIGAPCICHCLQPCLPLNRDRVKQCFKIGVTLWIYHPLTRLKYANFAGPLHGPRVLCLQAYLLIGTLCFPGHRGVETSRWGLCARFAFRYLGVNQ